MVSGGQTSRPPELVAASDQPIELIGDPLSVRLTVPSSTEAQFRRAIDSAPDARLSLSIEAIEAERNPGVVYGIYLNLPSDMSDADKDQRHVGNLVLFGIEEMNNRDVPHDGAPGFRHTFEVSSIIAVLRDANEFDPNETRVAFEILMPLPPPGQDARASSVFEELRQWARATPVRIGRIGLFVG